MNKYWAKTLKITCIVLFLTTGANLFSSCNDDLPADSYYTFTGEMMSDFLQTRETSVFSGVLWNVPGKWIF